MIMRTLKENGQRTGVATLRPVLFAPLGEQPLISVLITNYNYAAYLPFAIDSALNQTYRHCEIIICDDGSTDNSRDVLAEFARKYPCVRPVFQRNQGQSFATRSAFSVSRGEVICLLDADDVFLSSKLEKTMSAFRQSPNAGLIGHPVMTVDTLGHPLGVLPLLASASKTGWLAHEILTDGGTPSFRSPLNGIALRRDVANLIFDWMDEKTIPDELVWALAPLVTEVGWITDVLAIYRIHSGSRARSGVKNVCEGYQRRIVLARNTHRVQAEFLRKYAPDELSHFPGFEDSLVFVENNYIRARLAGAGWRQAYGKLRTHEKWISLGRAKRLLYSGSALLPLGIARSILRVAFGHNRIKSLVGMISHTKIVRGLQRQTMC